MNGLEAVEIKLSEAIDLSKYFRCDAEFYQKKYLVSKKIIESNSYDILGNYLKCLADYHANGSYEVLRDNVSLLSEPNYAYMVRTVDLEHNDFEKELIYVDRHSYEFLSKTKVYGEEIIINKIGSAGKVYFMPILNKPVTLGMNQFMLRLKDTQKVYYIYLYLSSKYGKTLLEQRVNGTIPPTIDKISVKSILVPQFSDNFYIKLKSIVIESENKKIEAFNFYASAQNLLLSHLGLANYKPTKKGITIKSLADSFGVTGRLDSEYYQPKYDEILSAINKFDLDKLGSVVLIKKSIEPGSECYGDYGIPFVRVSNLSKYEISEPDIKIPLDIVQNIDELYPKKDTILLSKDGSVGIAYKVDENMNYVTSGAILHLVINNLNRVSPDYLTLVLNSIIVQSQAERDAGGSIIQHWKPSEIADIIIPILDMTIQNEIANKVQESFALRKKSKSLLETAKQAVEMAIEQGEAVATNWLKNIKL